HGPDAGEVPVRADCGVGPPGRPGLSHRLVVGPRRPVGHPDWHEPEHHHAAGRTAREPARPGFRRGRGGDVDEGTGASEEHAREPERQPPHRDVSWIAVPTMSVHTMCPAIMMPPAVYQRSRSCVSISIVAPRARASARAYARSTRWFTLRGITSKSIIPQAPPRTVPSTR